MKVTTKTIIMNYYAFKFYIVTHIDFDFSVYNVCMSLLNHKWLLG